MFSSQNILRTFPNFERGHDMDFIILIHSLRRTYYVNERKMDVSNQYYTNNVLFWSFA